MSLKGKILKNPILREVFASGTDIYLVGGSIRNLIHNAELSKDMDFVVKKDIKALVNRVSSRLKGKTIEFKKEQMLRIVLKDKTTLDFSVLADNISHDLKTRDFTFNAIAYSPQEGIIDLFNGIEDIKKGMVRQILKQNFKNDPLRLLRAYRFSSELCMNIHMKTRKTAKELKGLIKYSACERITLEFLKLLDGKCPLKALKMALKDGLLTEILSLSFNVLEKNINTISKIEENLKKIPKGFLTHNYTHLQGLSPNGLLRLEGLLSGSGQGKNLLCLSNAISKRVEIVSNLIDKFKGLRTPATKGLQAPDTYELFWKANDALFDLLILTGNTGLIKEAHRFLKIMKKGALSGDEIIELTGIQEGPEIGSIINEMKRLQFEGIIKNRAGAVKWLRSLK